MVRKALGRGLDALLPGPVSAVEKAEGVTEVDIDRVRPNVRQPREEFSSGSLESLAESLRTHGLLQPIVVRRVSDGYELIAGERRWRGAQRAGLHRIPALIREADSGEALELALVENLQRIDLNPIEEARGYRALLDEVGSSQEEVAAVAGKNRSTVANYLRLLRLPEPIQKSLADGDLSMGHARAILGLEDAAAQLRLAEEAIARGWSVRQTEARVRSHQRPSAMRAVAKDPDVQAAERELTESLGAKVMIHGQRTRADRNPLQWPG